MVSALIQENLRRCGINPGDTLLIHSSLRRTSRTYTITPLKVMQSFLEAVGPHGTLLFPLFNFDFTKGVPFDIRSTPSHMGDALRGCPSASWRSAQQTPDLLVRDHWATGEEV